MNFARTVRPHFADHHHAGVDANAHGDVRFSALTQLRGEPLRSLDDVEAGENRTLGVVVVGDGVAEIGQYAIAGVLMNVAAVAVGTLDTHLLIGAQQRAQGLGVETPGQRRRPDDVCEQHRELATLSFAAGP
jgi:hypothetical protein